MVRLAGLDARCVLYHIITGELSVEKYSEAIKTEIILLIVYQSDLLPETQTACYAWALILYR
ncbi:MAG: hypothetical protein L6247_06775 [Desulfobacteraceae bacterium]|nr:hypothetical protein [Pseudomonadota bacterium]MBU4464176.1 hypothetical protein [Pseudomonadota bacterium]MCG2755249.1 hypothetical protein [Desulfobacteraceae bacterium]